MLGLLVDYSRKHGLEPEPGFTAKTVRWAIACDASGRFLEVLDLGGEDSRAGRSFPKCPELSQPEIKRGGAGCRPFLVDSADVVALLADGEPDPKLLAKHAYFTGLLRQASAFVPALSGIAATLDDPDQLAAIQAALRAQKAKPTDKATFFIPGANPAYLVESDAWHDWWRGFRKTLGDNKPAKKPRKAEEPAALALCLATGELAEPVPTHPKIAGLSDVGGLAMGDALASFKQESFCSYGLVQSANAAVSEQGAAEYRAALNHLLRENGRRLAGAKVVPWFQKRVPPEEDVIAMLFGDGLDEGLALKQVRELLSSFETGKRPDLQDNHYYALTLSGASGRVMVRDWMEGQFSELVESAYAWFDDLSIVRRDGNGLAPEPKIRPLLYSLVRDPKDLPQPLEARMWRAAVRHEPIPRDALARALARVRVDILKDQPFDHARLGVLKAFLLRKPKGDFRMEPYLDEDHPEAAYQCGRLMAMLAALQYKALGDVGAGVVQRYYAAASATPALVLGRLVRTAQFHLAKLDRGLALWHEGRIAGTWGKIRQRRLPRTLDLEGQSLFALGYYQQIASDRSRTRQDAAAGKTPESPEETAQ